MKKRGEDLQKNAHAVQGLQATGSPSSAIMSVFRVFQQELDTKHDKYERLVKISRDVTIESKRTIFLLHRVTSVQDAEAVLNEADSKLDAVRQKIGQIAKELQGEDIYQFHRAFTPGSSRTAQSGSCITTPRDLGWVHGAVGRGRSPRDLSWVHGAAEVLVADEGGGIPSFSPAAQLHAGSENNSRGHLSPPAKMEAVSQWACGERSIGIQEFVEAASFLHYIRHRSLVSLEEINARLVFVRPEEPPSMDSVEAGPAGALTFQVTPSDYLLGVADLTGELMRLCISSVGNGDIDTPFQLSQFLRQIHDGFFYIGNTGPYEVSKKLHVLRQSLGKVEDACYTLRVRGSEIPKHMLADVFSSRSALIDPDEGPV
ncbi:X Translin-associated factor [Takifugu flavidus]|uniref:X Translin-associated factor n=1 Tax=Takifugu flavidus TaxID=433684 RepID=A0A5C6PIW9_9TELE|nr:X Translin-associated factor [Takifugu flavidus]